LCAEQDIRLVHYGTDYVFDGSKKSPYTETDTANPLNHYAAGKFAGEQAVLHASSAHLVLRTSWVFDWHPTQAKTFIHTILKMAREGRPIRSATDQVSVPTFASDLAGWTMELVRGGAGGLFHAVNDEGLSRFDWTESILAEAVHASSDAPINYFDRPAEFSKARYWDGGVSGYNNPVLAAVLEALANRVPRTGVDALSIGTGTVRLPLEDGEVRPPLAQKRDRPALTGDLRKMALSILDDPPDAATFIAHVALGQPLPDHRGEPIGTGCVVRMSPVVRPVKEAGVWKLPHGLTEDEFVALTDLEMDAVENAQVALLHKLGTAWLAGHVPNQPIRSSSDFSCEIGHATFREARTAWQNLQQARTPLARPP